MSAIDLRSATKRFGDTSVLTGVDLSVPDGSITAVLGASGSGKTTLLRLIAGFESLDGGTLKLGDRIVDDGVRAVAAQHRGIGYVPQDGALFPHLSVRANIAFGLARDERTKVGELLDLVGLAELAKRYPHQLSGGQQQRVALARALAVGPSVVLLDEPFSALDASLRGDLRRDVARILAETGTTTVLVTHDQDEAMALADQIALLADGTIIAAADPRRLYRDPPGPDAAASTGEVNLLAAHVSGDHALCVLGSIPVSRREPGEVNGSSRLLLRPEQLLLRMSEGEAMTPAVVDEVQYYGHDALARLRVRDDDAPLLLARIPGVLELEPGQTVWIEVAGAGIVWPDGHDGRLAGT
jgi:iron(III) transport system ATP-binding protein